MSSTEELACVYASLILADEGLPVTAEKINALVEAAGVKVAAYWPGLFAQYLAGKDINEMLTASSTGLFLSPISYPFSRSAFPQLTILQLPPPLLLLAPPPPPLRRLRRSPRRSLVPTLTWASVVSSKLPL
jgi:hypothetical protein